MTASEIRALFPVASRPEVVSLAGGMPNIAALPMDALATEVADLVAREGQVALQYGSAQGRPELREQICEVMALEGIRADPDDVVVTVGSQMALDLVTRIYCDPGDVVLAEGPSYVGALGSFAAYQARVVHVAMDANGLVPDLLRAALATVRPRPKFLYTVPPFHTRRASHSPSTGAPRCSRSVGVRRRRRRSPGLQQAHLPGAPLARPRGRLPGLVLQDVRVRPAGGMGTRTPAVRDRLVQAAEPATLSPPSFTRMLVSR
jgi:2-aminoadipate transaminase